MIQSHTIRQVALAASLMLALGVHAAEVAGIKVDEKMHVGNSELVLNGAGLRSKLFIKVYVGALYVAQKSASPAVLLDAATPRRMSLRLLRDVGADTFLEAMEEGLKNNNSPTELAEFKTQSEQLASLMKGIGKVHEGDTITIDFMSDSVVVAVNGDGRGKVAGSGFAKALLKTWLGDKPADASLKKALLGS